MPSLLQKLRELEAEKPRSEKKELGTGVFLRQTKGFPLSLFSFPASLEPSLLSSLYSLTLSQPIHREEILFLDTETTGLSGGAGTVAFEIGLGYFEENTFRVEQFFMHHYAQEEAMLSALAKLCEKYTLLCTFNGRTFDAPLLHSRFMMNHLSDSLPKQHADVLYPARRLFKERLGSCTLAHLEEELLGVSREDDLPGALVPQTYFTYQRDGNFAPIQKILAHNRQDIVSLAQLFFFLCKHRSHPENAAYPEDLFSLAKEAQRSGDTRQSVKCYRMLASTPLRPEAFSALALHEKRTGNIAAAMRLYETMLYRGDRPVEAAIALAKLSEHRLCDPERALAYTRRALLLLSEPTLIENTSVQETQKELQYRYTRLRKKCAAREEQQ